MTTLKDIGAELGLSAATVSRALNGFPEVSPKTRQAVLETARRLHYQPNRIAQMLVSGKSGMVGMLVHLAPEIADDRSFVEIMVGLSSRLAERDVDLVFHVVTDGDELAHYRRMADKSTLDGFILNAPLVDDPRIGFLRREKIPFVVHGSTPEHRDYAFYDIDNFGVAAKSVALLHDLGHCRIAMLNSPPQYTFAAERLRGFTQTLAGFGLTTPDRFIFHGPQTEEFGYTRTRAALSGRLGPMPSAFICASTLSALGVVRAVRGRNLRIPEDISVIAHDDAIPSLRAVGFEPALTVTSAPLRDACAPLADKLIDLLAGVPAQKLQTTFDPPLVIRNSTGPAPQAARQPW